MKIEKNQHHHHFENGVCRTCYSGYLNKMGELYLDRRWYNSWSRWEKIKFWLKVMTSGLVVYEKP